MWITAIIIAVVVFAGFMIASNMLLSHGKRALTRARIFGDDAKSEGPGADVAGVFGDNRDKSEIAATAEATMRRLGVRVDEANTKLGRALMHAGISNPNAVIIYLTFQRFIGPLLAIAGVFVVLMEHEGLSQLLIHIIAGGLLIVIGIFGPKLYVENCAHRRRDLLQRGFPDTLDLMLVCVESGLALDAAFSRVCGELGRVHPEVTKELNRTRIELSLLNNRSLALQNLAERTNLIAYRYFVAALIQSERFGTSLSDTLRVMAEEYRIKRIVTAEEKAARIPVLMTVPLIFCLLPSFMLVILGPAIISFIKSGFLS